MESATCPEHAMAYDCIISSAMNNPLAIPLQTELPFERATSRRIANLSCKDLVGHRPSGTTG